MRQIHLSPHLSVFPQFYRQSDGKHLLRDYLVTLKSHVNVDVLWRRDIVFVHVNN